MKSVRRYRSILRRFATKRNFAVACVTVTLCITVLNLLLKEDVVELEDVGAVTGKRCVLPVLDPFDAEMMNFVKDEGDGFCHSGPTLSRLDEEGILTVSGEGISAAVYMSVLRPVGDDFDIKRGNGQEISLTLLKTGKFV